MNVRRSWFFFLLMLLLSACGILLLAKKDVTESWHVLRGTTADSGWQTVGTGGGKLAAAARLKGGKLSVRYFTTDGALLSEQSAALPKELEGGTAARLYPVREGLAYAGIYGPNALELYLYRIGAGREDGRLLALPCVGETFAERASRTAFSEFSGEEGVLSFAVRTDDAIQAYLCREDGGVEPSEQQTCDGEAVLSFLPVQGGGVLLGGAGCLKLNGAGTGTPVEGQSVTCLTQGRGGWYYLDAARLDVCFADAAFGSSQRMLRLDTTWNGKTRELTAAALTREEKALLLLDGSTLLLTDAEGTRELAGILRPTQLQAGLALMKYAALSLGMGALLWLLLCGMKRGYASMTVFRGGLLAAVALLFFTVLYYVALEPELHEFDLRGSEATISGVLRAARADSRMDDESLCADLCRMLEGAENGQNVRAVLARRSDGAWVTSDGRLALTQEGFSPELAERAQNLGSAGVLENGVLRYARVLGEDCISLRVEGVRETDGIAMLRLLMSVSAVLVCISVLILLSVSVDIRRISGNMESISRGNLTEPLELHTGDELESMASVVNSLAVSLREQEEARAGLERSYRRFVPEKVLALLGKQSIQEVDKSTFAARRMAVMTVWFSFPEALYTDHSDSRLLFDSVNEVIERTASIVSRKGGTVFHFSYDGFDVVMDEDGEAVSTAVAIRQEALSFNEQRAGRGLPPVTLRIALDVGDVMLGIVGDTSKMEPTTISSSLSTARELIGLCNRLKAGILCTETIISQRQEYGSRYLGKCAVGSHPVRVYEVFDGDEFSVRRGKASSVREFSQGVYDLYGGDAAAAKHTFLRLAHSYPLDGGVRYYLYLADRLEHDPSLPCVLNVDSADGEGM